MERIERIERLLRTTLRSWSIAAVLTVIALLAQIAEPGWTRTAVAVLALTWCALTFAWKLREERIAALLRGAVVLAFGVASVAGIQLSRIDRSPVEHWEQRAREHMTEVARTTGERLLSLEERAERRARAALDPQADLRALAEPIVLDGRAFAVGVSVMRDGVLLEWAGTVPGPDRVGDVERPLLVDHGSRRYLTVQVDDADGRSAYCDVGLGVEGDLLQRAGFGVQPGDRIGTDPLVPTRLLPEEPPLPVSTDEAPVLVRGVPPEDPWVWVRVEAPRPVDEERRAANAAGAWAASALLVGLVGLALIGWRAWPGRGARAAAVGATALWLLVAAGLRIGLERARILDLALDRAPAPFGLLLDPTYFATTAGGGLARSTADFLLTAAWISAAATLLLPAWLRLFSTRNGSLARAAGLASLLLANVAFVHVLPVVQTTVANNANPTLIGLDSPFFTLPFVLLHVAMMLTLLPMTGWIVLGWERWSRGRAGTIGVLLATLAMAAWVRVAPPDAMLGAWVPALPVLGLVVRPLVRAQSLSLRAFAGLLVVLWFAGAQSHGLERAYTAMKEDVALSEAEQRLRPLDNWRRFLLEELLREISEDPARLSDLADDARPRDNAAFELWATTVLPSHEYGSRVELRDAQGRLVSEFDIALPYEPAPLRQMRQRVPPGERPYRVDTIEIMTEQGPFLVYRGRLDLGALVPGGDASILTIDLPYATAEGVIAYDQLRSMGLQILGFDPRSGVEPRRTFDRAVFTGRIGEERVVSASDPELIGLEREAIPEPGVWATVRRGGVPYHVSQVRIDDRALLVAFTEPALVERLLDLSRLAALDLAVAGAALLLFGLLRLLRVAPGERWPEILGGVGFQERMLGSMLMVALVPVFLLGISQERRAAERERDDNLVEVSDRLGIAMQLLASNLDDLAAALIGGEYVQDVIATGNSVAPRAVGPYELAQVMVFDPQGELVLDESLRDLDPVAARSFLDAVVSGEMLLESDADFGWFVGRCYPVLGPDDHTYRVYVRRLLTDEDLGRLARIVRADLTLYDGPWAVVSSQAYLYRSGLREPVLSAQARPVLDGGARSVVEAERQGGLLVANGWSVLPGPFDPQRGILAARLLARATQSAREQQQAQLFVFGLSSLAMVVAVAAGLLLSGRIVGPIRELVVATARVGRGDLDQRVRETGSDEIGRLVRSFNRMTDQLRDSQRELAARRSFLEAMLTSLRTGVIVLDGDGEVLETNPAAAELLGSQSASFLQRVAAHDDESALVDTEIVLERSDGPRTLRTVIGPAALEDGRRGRLVVFDDVSELLASRRLALYAQMARQVAHEVKNPLTPIQLSAQMVRQATRDAHPRLPEIVDENVRQIEGQVERLRNIASEFSLLGRERLDDLGRVEVEPLLQEVRSLYPAPEGGWEIEVHAASGLVVWASREALLKVLTNLVENARHAMSGRGTVRLRVEAVGARVRIRIEDEGPGIDPDVQGRLFEPYFSTKSTGTGLGLVICRSLMEKMGGRISLRSRTDAVGAVAELELSAASSPQPTDPVADGGNDSPSFA